MPACMMTYPHAPSTHCVLPIDHDGPHVTRSGHGWHDSDDMDGGVTAALIEKEAEPTDVWRRRAEKAEDRADDAHNLIVALRADLAATEDRAEQAEKERDEARAEGEECRKLATRYAGLTAREHLDAAWDAAHVPADGIIPEGRMFLDRGTAGVVVVGAAGKDLASRGSSWERRLVDPPTPARPEGAEELTPVVDEMLTAYWAGDLNGPDAADFLAERGVRVVTEERS